MPRHIHTRGTWPEIRARRRRRRHYALAVVLLALAALLTAVLMRGAR